MSKQRVAILGSTGSIGLSTLAVIDQNPNAFEITALCANTSAEALFEQIKTYRPNTALLADEASAQKLITMIADAGLATEVLSGSASLDIVASETNVDTVVAAIVGAAGLSSTMAAVTAGKRVLLANKEALVCGGRLVMEMAGHTGAELLPLDSEHNAIFQCLPNGKMKAEEVVKIHLTGSGGPFRGRNIQDLADVTPEQACAHPNWSMGPKISVDSATMMNKGLELIEACWLFDVEPSAIEIVLHPQSIVHSMVEYRDGSLLAQLGSPDMQIPIAHGLAWPTRMTSGASPLDLFGKELTFEKPDFANYPCLSLAIEAMQTGGAAPLILNAANEIAVDAFLSQRIGYLDIPKVIAATLDQISISEPNSVQEVIEQDKIVRLHTTSILSHVAA